MTYLWACAHECRKAERGQDAPVAAKIVGRRRDAVDEDRACEFPGVLAAGQAVKQRCLTSAGAAHDGKHLAGHRLPIDTLEQLLVDRLATLLDRHCHHQYMSFALVALITHRALNWCSSSLPICVLHRIAFIKAISLSICVPKCHLLVNVHPSSICNLIVNVHSSSSKQSRCRSALFKAISVSIGVHHRHRQ
jgi:hypothetical protein